VGAAGSRTSLLLALTLGLVAVVAAVITPNGAAAALIPVAVMVALRLGRLPSTLLMPVAFAASAGSMLALTGSPVNVIVSEAAADAGVGAFGFFSFALVGLPLAAGTIAISLLLGPRLLPLRRARSIPPDLSRHAHTLLDEYRLDGDDVAPGLFTRESGVAEVVVRPRSELVGAEVFPGMVTDSGDLLVLAIRRGGDAVEGEARVAVGDALLLRGTWAALDDRIDAREVLVVDPPQSVRSQAVPLGPGAKRALGVLAGMVALLASGAVPAAIATLLAAGAMVVLRVVSAEQAYRAVSWGTVILIGGMISVSTAIASSGAGERIADGLVDTVGEAGPSALLAGLFVLTAVFGQLISNTATALIVVPIAVSAAAELHVSPRPVLMSVAVAAAASFLTPVATPANLMVMGPGGYRFGDYWKLGLCLMALFFVVATFLVPVFWGW
jgi:di/tricarboxylate transporter